MPRLSSTLGVAAFAIALSACTVTITPSPSSQSAADCPGGSNGCSVADHNAMTGTLPRVAVDVSQQIHDYILAHPEIIAEAQRSLATRQAAERQVQAKRVLADSHDAVFADPADPVIGNPKGDVTIVEFYDLDCPFCRALAPSLRQLIEEDHGVRLVLKDYPILGPGSELAARYALAAMKQGKYTEFHEAVLASKLPEHQLDEGKIQGFAVAAGLDVARLRGDAADPAVTKRIADNRALAAKLGISGTPGLIIEDQMQGGALSLDALKKLVADVRARKVASDR
ncbi:MAG: thioredoxin domain-containing protein [Paludibacterium sp.]|uniref:DsbA family protein n=1 Tax=Paludibacterium sp. TaxID=1917523 RepID=UPI0025FA3207|nr:DsbA family protein [Paludibacterium sp.]MBV8047783.1 thioredoxin domain-containing protein [Paludibacterium sp.]